MVTPVGSVATAATAHLLHAEPQFHHSCIPTCQLLSREHVHLQLHTRHIRRHVSVTCIYEHEFEGRANILTNKNAAYTGTCDWIDAMSGVRSIQLMLYVNNSFTGLKSVNNLSFSKPVSGSILPFGLQNIIVMYCSRS